MNRNANTGKNKPANRREAKGRANLAEAAPAKKASKQTHTFEQGKGFVEIKPGAIAAAAKKVAATSKTRKAPVKVKPAPKRVETDKVVVERALAHFQKLADAGETNKVGLVRDLALWPKGEKKLQRRDVFEIVKTRPKLEIADATISTQFQFARSGRAKQNA